MSTSSIPKRILGLFKVTKNLDDLLIASRNWDGRVREDAVRRLGGLGNTEAIKELLIRLNDWVPQVRSAAKDAILRLANTSSNAAVFIEHLPEIYHLNKCRRDKHVDIIRKICDSLLSDGNRSLVVDGVSNENCYVARICYALVSNHKLLPFDSLVEVGLSSKDFIIREVAFVLLRDSEPDRHCRLLAIALKDKHTPIRRAAFEVRLGHGEADSVVASYLFDLHSSIREIAVNELLTRGLNVLDVYRNALSNSLINTSKCAIWGVGYLSCKESIPALIKLLESPIPCIRKQSLSTLSSLGVSWLDDNIHGFLSDPSAAVSKEAARLCRRLGILFDAEELLSKVEASPYEHTKNIIFDLVKKINKWERLIFLLKIRSSIKPNQESELLRITGEIFHWNDDFNKSGSQPTHKQLDLLKRYYGEQLQYNDHNLSRIMFTIRTSVAV